MRIGLLICGLCWMLNLSAQEIEVGDVDYVFESLEEAKKHPELVYHLKLRKKKLTDIPEAVFSFPNLKTLDLSKNRIDQIPLAIGKLVQLEELNLAQNDITVLPPQIGKLQALERLILNRNEIKKLPQFLEQLSALRYLDLWDNNLQEFPPSFNGLEQLEVLDLRGIIIAEAVQKRLNNSLVKTKIYYSQGCNCDN